MKIGTSFFNLFFLGESLPLGMVVLGGEKKTEETKVVLQPVRVRNGLSSRRKKKKKMEESMVTSENFELESLILSEK